MRVSTRWHLGRINNVQATSNVRMIEPDLKADLNWQLRFVQA